MIVVSSGVPMEAVSARIGVHPAITAFRIKAAVVGAGNPIKVRLPQAVAHLVDVGFPSDIDKIKVETDNQGILLTSIVR